MKLPTISIVTPSFNQAAYLEATLQSVLTQGYPALEYLVIDGGSNDDSPAIIRRYADQLAYWISEPDGGQYAGINRGLQRSTGEIMAWLNSDDMYFPWTLQTVGTIFAQFPEVEWITAGFPAVRNRHGQVVHTERAPGYARRSFLRGAQLPGRGWHATGWIQQESTFWRRSLWERIGGTIDTSYRLAADFDLWARFFAHAELATVEAQLGSFRIHGDQKTGQQLARYYAEAEQSLAAHEHAYGRAETALRRRLSQILTAGRLRRLTPRRRALLNRTGLLQSAPFIRWDGQNWVAQRVNLI